MARVMVAYGPATPDPQDGYEADSQCRRAEQWAPLHSSSVLTWRREGQSMLGRRIEQRPRLLEALFCIRANFAEDLWMPKWPGGWNEWDKAFIFAVLSPRSGRLVIDGNVAIADTDAPTFTAAQRWLSFLEVLDPRVEHESQGLGHPDIGATLGVEEGARLAHKLRTDFRLNDEQIAEWLDTFDYASASGKPYKKGGVANLRDRYPTHAVEFTKTQLNTPEGAADSGVSPRLLDVAFGHAAESLVTAARESDADAPETQSEVQMISLEDHEGTDSPMTSRTNLMRMIGASPIIRAIHLDAETDLAEDPRDVMFLLALLDELGVQVVVDGAPVASWDQRPQRDITAYLQGRSAVRLHQALRAHDRGSVTDPRLSLTAAYATAQRIRARGWQESLEHAARTLNQEGVPTRRGDGQWWPASVKELLEEGPS